MRVTYSTETYLKRNMSADSIPLSGAWGHVESMLTIHFTFPVE
jgi:hypothetical protein